jgi:hypothetical protein
MDLEKGIQLFGSFFGSALRNFLWRLVPEITQQFYPYGEETTVYYYKNRIKVKYWKYRKVVILIRALEKKKYSKKFTTLEKFYTILWKPRKFEEIEQVLGMVNFYSEVLIHLWKKKSIFELQWEGLSIESQKFQKIIVNYLLWGILYDQIYIYNQIYIKKKISKDNFQIELELTNSKRLIKKLRNYLTKNNIKKLTSEQVLAGPKAKNLEDC